MVYNLQKEMLKYEKSILKGKREELVLSDHKTIVIVPDKIIPYEEGRAKLRKLLLEMNKR